MRTLIPGLALLLAACSAEPPPPPPQLSPWALTRDAVGRYCSMTVSDHPGPKGQILVGPEAEAVWFSSVRDAVAFTRLPEEPRDIRAFYVNDMSTADWERPGDAGWIAAESAWFVIGSRRQGGMGAPEAVPFGRREAAAAFSERYGGHLARLAQIPTDYVLGAFGDADATAAAR